jgi:hypothetical protein
VLAERASGIWGHARRLARHASGRQRLARPGGISWLSTRPPVAVGALGDQRGGGRGPARLGFAIDRGARDLAWRRGRFPGSSISTAAPFPLPPLPQCLPRGRRLEGFPRSRAHLVEQAVRQLRPAGRGRRPPGLRRRIPVPAGLTPAALESLASTPSLDSPVRSRGSADPVSHPWFGAATGGPLRLAPPRSVSPVVRCQRAKSEPLPQLLRVLARRSPLGVEAPPARERIGQKVQKQNAAPPEAGLPLAQGGKPSSGESRGRPTGVPFSQQSSAINVLGSRLPDR